MCAHVRSVHMVAGIRRTEMDFSREWENVFFKQNIHIRAVHLGGSEALTRTSQVKSRAVCRPPAGPGNGHTRSRSG